MALGTVKWFTDAKGYGFRSRAEDGKDVFVHFPSLPGGGFRTVGQGTGGRHLAARPGRGTGARRKDGTRPAYRTADPTPLKICSIVCDGVERDARDKANAILGRPKRGGRR